MLHTVTFYPCSLLPINGSAKGFFDIDAVAAVIYRKCALRPMAHTYAAGAINKLCAAFAKFIPQSVMLRLLNAVYFS